MISGISGSMASITVNEPLAGALRRELLGQLNIFKDLIDHYNAPAYDRLTQSIIGFLNDFKQALNTGNPDPVIIQEDFISRLQILLTDPIDPIRPVPLEKDALLGIDGYTYNKKALAFYLSTAEHRYRSPKFPQSLDSFWVVPHPIVPTMIQWLEKKNAFQPDLILEQRYNQLVATGNLPAIPTKESEKIRLSNEKIRQVRKKIIRQRVEFEKKENLNLILVEFEHLLNNSDLEDSLSESIRTWHQLFTMAFETCNNVDLLQTEFITDLQELLKDPITLTVLDDEPFLGSDGYTYSKESLLLYIDAAPEPNRRRSPKNPNDPAKFTVAAHPIACRMVAWLKEKESHHPSQDISDLYEVLLQNGNVPQLPTIENIHLAHLAEDQAASAHSNQVALADFQEQQEQLSSQQYIQAAFEEVHQMIDQNSVQLTNALEQVKLSDEAGLNILNQEIGQLAVEQQAIKNRIQVLAARIAGLDPAIDKGYRHNAQLQNEIERAREAIRERNEGWLGSLVITLGSIGACALASAILGPIGAGIVTPMQGGAKYSISIIF